MKNISPSGNYLDPLSTLSVGSEHRWPVYDTIVFMLSLLHNMFALFHKICCFRDTENGNFQRMNTREKIRNIIIVPSCLYSPSKSKKGEGTPFPQIPQGRSTRMMLFHAPYFVGLKVNWFHFSSFSNLGSPARHFAISYRELLIFDTPATTIMIPISTFTLSCLQQANLNEIYYHCKIYSPCVHITRSVTIKCPYVTLRIRFEKCTLGQPGQKCLQVI